MAAPRNVGRALLESSFVVRRISPILLLIAAAAGGLVAYGQKKTKPYADLPILQPKEKKDENRNEVLPPVREPPAAVSAATARLTFEALPLTGKGLLSAQLRESMRTLLRNSSGSTVLKIRAFVAGSGDLRRVQEIAAEVFGERKQPLPALSVVQVGALPLEGAQVSMEATLEGRRDVNPNGLAFVSAQAGSSIADALQHVRSVLQRAGADEPLRATCFVSVLQGPESASFDGASVVVVQMAREAVRPAAACEAVARLRTAPEQEVRILRNERGEPAAALVNAPRLALSGIQLGFGKQDSDVALVLDRVDKGLGGAGSGLKQAVMANAYVITRAVAPPLTQGLNAQTGQPRPLTILPFEGLSSIDAVMGLDVIAVAQ